MVVYVVDVDRIAVLEPEGDPPVSGDRHGVVTLTLALQRVRPKSGQVDVARATAPIQHGENVQQLRACSGATRREVLPSYSAFRPRCLNDTIIAAA